MTIEEAKKNIGKAVRYVPYIGCPKKQIEHGYIKGVNDNFVFVCFGARTMDGGEACRPKDLKFD